MAGHTEQKLKIAVDISAKNAYGIFLFISNRHDSGF